MSETEPHWTESPEVAARLATALDRPLDPDVLHGRRASHCEGHGGPGRRYCCQHPDAGWPCAEESTP